MRINRRKNENKNVVVEKLDDGKWIVEEVEKEKADTFNTLEKFGIAMNVAKGLVFTFMTIMTVRRVFI